MPFRDAIDENGVALGVVGSQRQNLLIRSRLIPRTRSRAIWEFDDDQVPRPGPLQYLGLLKAARLTLEYKLMVRLPPARSG
jgi:hypothetical protein